MIKISLDRTINETYKFLKGENALPECIGIQDFCGMPYSFVFEGSKNNFNIKDVGLAKLVYEKAISCFQTTKINKDGSKEKVFEPLQAGNHISDCVNSFSSDVLCWYFDKKDKPLEIVKFPECIVQKSDVTTFDKAFDDSSNGSARVDVVDEALNAATYTYCRNLLQSGVTEEEVKAIYSTETGFKNLELESFRKYAQEEFSSSSVKTEDFEGSTKDSNILPELK